MMEKKPPTVWALLIRVFVFVAAGGVLGSGSILAFYRFTLQATTADQQIITGIGWKVTVIGGLIYLGTIILIMRPLFQFTSRLGRVEVDDKFLAQVQQEALNLGPRMAILAIFFYLIVTPLNLSLSLHQLGWGYQTLWYAVFAAGLSALLLTPLAINLAHWAVKPVLYYTTTQVRDLAPARRAGWAFSLRWKLLVTFLPLVAAALIFSSLIGYSQTQEVLDNLEKMQAAFVTADEQGQLADAVEHKSDPRVRSAKFYQERMGNLRRFYVIFIASALAIALVLTLFSAAEITRPVRTLTQAAERIIAGGQGESIRLVTNDEFSELAGTINQMMKTILGHIRTMETVVARLRDGLKQMDDTVNTILAVSSEQSSGAAEQASAVQETGSIAEEIVATARQIAEKAKTVDDIAATTLTACKDGSARLDVAQSGFRGIAEQVEAIQTAMRQLEANFEHTYKIVEIMEEIAEQTELLSLNAALEAAGAGAEGRRFQVVAEATRRLALRSAESTKEVKVLVQTIQEATQASTGIAGEGKTRVATGGAAIEEVVKALRAISSLAGGTSTAAREITLSTKQQSTASEQLAASVGEVQAVAQRVEEGSKEIQSSIAELRSFAEALRDTVER